MAATPKYAALLIVASVLAACSQSESLYSPLSGEPAKAQTGSTQIAAATITPPNPNPAPNPTNTIVGQKAAQLRGDHQRLQAQLNERLAAFQEIRAANVAASQQYFGSVGTINARLQAGTTPGNPILVDQWNTAQSVLDRLDTDIGRLNRLSNILANDAAFAGYLLEATRAAFGISGALEEDHRALAVLQDDISRSQVSVERLLNDVSEDVSRQSGFLAAERRNLTSLSAAIKAGQPFGGSLNTRATSAIAPASMAVGLTPPPVGGRADRRPLVTIRFDRANVAYEQQLYNAVSQALERRPDASFDVVAVAPNRGGAGQVALSSGAARRNAEQVLRSLTDMGLPPARVAISATSSPAVDTNEVQIFVR